MTIFLNSETQVLVQGATGREASMVIGHMLAYGTQVAAGVTPGKGGETVHDLPVYDTVWQAQRAHQATASLIYVPPPMVYDAVLEAIDNGLRTLLIPTENVPRHDMLRLLHRCEAAGVTLIGPNSVGAINPSARVKLGAIGGDDPTRCFVPGRVGIISRSGGMTAELGYMVKQAGYGVSRAFSVGGDTLIGSPPATLLAAFEQDPDTDAVILFSEPGTHFEADVAELLHADGFTKPLVFVVGGLFTETLPEGTVFGHSAALIQAGQGRPSDKQKLLAEAGAIVAYSYDQLTACLQQAMNTEVS